MRPVLGRLTSAVVVAGPAYGHEHRQLRDYYRPLVDAGEGWCMEIVCVMDDRWISPGTAWDLAHDRDTGGYLGPAHPRCNRREGAIFGNGQRDVEQELEQPSWSSRRW